MDYFRRPLLPCLFVYILGLWLVHSLGHEWPTATMALAAIIIAGCGMLAWKRRDATVVVLLLIMVTGMAVMMVRERRCERAERIVQALDSALPRQISGKVRAAAELDDTERFQLTLQHVRVTSGSNEISVPGKMLVNLSRDALAGGKLPVTGETVSFPGYITEPTALHNFFGYDRLEALRHKEIFAVARPLNLRRIVLHTDRGGVTGSTGRRLTDFRRDVSGLLNKHVKGREGRLMTAMLFNDMRGINDEEKVVFRESGTYHLFAVSGMHVAILGLVLGLVFRTLRFGLVGSYVAVAVVLFLYLWVIGFVPSATRSYLMLLAFTAGYLLRREVDPITSLTFSAAVVIAWDPAAPWDVGFLLSVGGVAGIVLLVPLMQEWLRVDEFRDEVSGMATSIALPIVNCLLVTVAAGAALFPLQIYLFGYWNLLSIPANLVQASLSSLTLSAGVLTVVLGYLNEGLAAAAGATASAFMNTIYRISAWAAHADWALFHFRQFPAWLLVLVYALILGGYYLTFRDTPEFRVKSRARFAVHAVGCAGLLFGFQLYDSLKPAHLEIWSFDVGQGDATLVRFPGGETMLIDGGKSDPDMGAVVIVPQLRGLGISRLDYIVATHDDDDHTGGLAEVIQQVGCDRLFLPEGFVAKSRSSAAMLSAAREQGCVVQEVAAGYTASSGACSLTVLNPMAGELHAEDNENSVALRIEYGKFSALLMGDAGLAVEGRLINQWAGEPAETRGVTLLKLGHHGSRTASGAEFISTVRPVCAIASCGAKNRFGHPAAAVVDRVEKAGSRLFRTDHHGAVRFWSDGNKTEVQWARR